MRQEEAEGEQRDDRERASQQRAPGGEGHRFCTLPDQEEPVTGEGGECGVLRRSAQADRGNEVEHRVSPRRCEEKTGEQEANRLRLGGDVRGQDRPEAPKGGLRGEDQSRHAVTGKPGRTTW